MTLDDIYGVSVTDYCIVHDITLEELIHKVELDLDLLHSNFTKQVEAASTDYELTRAIADAISKKQAHLSRLKRITNGINK